MARKLFKSRRKQKTLYGALVGAAIIGAFYLFKKVAGGSRLDWFTKGFKIEKGKFIYIVEIVNPSNASITINNIFLNFYYADSIIGRVFYNETLTIPSNQTVTARIQVKAAPYGLAMMIKDLIVSLRRPLPLRITGGIKAEKVNIPIDETFVINPADYLP